MRMLRFGCGGSSDEFFQREHSGGLFCHHCTDLPSRCHQRNQANGSYRRFDAFPGGQKPDPGTAEFTPNPCQAFELTAKAIIANNSQLQVAMRIPRSVGIVL